jgi:hypothetical protein
MKNNQKPSIRIVLSIGAYGATEHFCGIGCPLSRNGTCILNGEKLEMDNQAMKSLRTENCKFLEINHVSDSR